MVHEQVTAQWRVRGESVHGAAHASDGLPNQGAISLDTALRRGHAFDPRRL